MGIAKQRSSMFHSSSSTSIDSKLFIQVLINVLPFSIRFPKGIWSICIHMSAKRRTWALQLNSKLLLMEIAVKEDVQAMANSIHKCKDNYSNWWVKHLRFGIYFSNISPSYNESNECSNNRYNVHHCRVVYSKCLHYHWCRMEPIRIHIIAC